MTKQNNSNTSRDNREQAHQNLLQAMEQKCADLPLCQVPSDIVIGQGNLDAQIMLIGEAPGAEEAKQRYPFVGRSGQLLNATLAKFGMEREQMYVSNIVKVRPPNNRDPEPEEIMAYLPYLRQEIELIKPALFITLGRFALNFFLPEEKISAVHGVLKRFRWQGEIIHLYPLYHPAAALRSTSLKDTFEEDVSQIPEALAYAQNKQEDDLHLDEIKDALF